MGTLADFIAERGIVARAERRTSNPNLTGEEAPGTLAQRHWLVTLTAGELGVAELRVPFSQGSAHTAEPTAADVLECMASDSASYENAGTPASDPYFEAWANEFGYDTDSRKAERTFRAVERQAGELRAFLGEDGYDELLWRTERE